MENATGELKGWILRNPESSRKCLSHAAAIFAQLRRTRHLACVDPLALISAVLYIRLYDLSKMRTPVNLAGLSGPSQECSKTLPPIRLDCLTDTPALNRWIEDAEPARIHITGVGILCGQVSSSRLLLETQRILQGSSAWRGMCQGLFRAASGLLSGKWSAFWEED
ncbi:hypothetical protein BDP81DRAFT_95720 [Colletotrichum phormii]|uniref:Transcription factor domain-containing protein n=1 Tax=Colletotrichum phormii TaxID=359342 RepID=A0AAI9ZIT7_9PEZI|nr:uncharacterized protein BDP81DRAFT_95720 [Colletotrichum phormii]KAK1625362.1 hypothetical protein BDP81DRAFT_95720 [Colletotrichum phormii]